MNARDGGAALTAARALLAALVVAVGSSCPATPPPSAECASSADCPDNGVCDIATGSCLPCDFDLPAPNNQCLPTCGNELGVGQPCTNLGGECNRWTNVSGGAFFCTIDFVGDAELAMCTRPCGVDSDCGTGSVCTGDPEDPNGDKGCVPATCAEGEGEGEEGEGEEGEGEGEEGEGEGEGE